MKIRKHWKTPEKVDVMDVSEADNKHGIRPRTVNTTGQSNVSAVIQMQPTPSPLSRRSHDAESEAIKLVDRRKYDEVKQWKVNHTFLQHRNIGSVTVTPLKSATPRYANLPQLDTTMEPILHHRSQIRSQTPSGSASVPPSVGIFSTPDSFRAFYDSNHGYTVINQVPQTPQTGKREGMVTFPASEAVIETLFPTSLVDVTHQRVQTGEICGGWRVLTWAGITSLPLRNSKVFATRKSQISEGFIIKTGEY
ncbi:hypothetical protein PROFUN_08932 [Planoprotostelium fungivorum]|uniref:Uncharacterized protein n=1 Tax=Planoprotostelium fungivorum TaxID=1890364 RepID=A0A2P6NIP9_9EUKA|nr:hypothetical protein PROFUN_08932 [Planoprotostelium fungivorum]